MKIKNLLNNHRRWCKGDYDNGHGRYCLVGAIKKCYPDNAKRSLVRTKILKEIVKLIPGYYGGIEVYNDLETTKFTDIQTILKKANV